jgi:hypothetical protein
MLNHRPLHSITVMASEAVRGRRFVSIDGRHAATSADAVGISEQDCEPGRALSALTGYSGLMEAAGAIPFGSLVKPASDGSGRAVIGSGTDYCGRAMTAAVRAGDALVVRLLEVSGINSSAADWNVPGSFAWMLANQSAFWSDALRLYIDGQPIFVTANA